MSAALWSLLSSSAAAVLVAGVGLVVAGLVLPVAVRHLRAAARACPPVPLTAEQVAWRRALARKGLRKVVQHG